jgi:gliding-associated putative ABC transporter substrate-binding component GldG
MKTHQNTDKNIQRMMTILIIILINILSVYLFYRIDLTKNKSYTLSRSTRELIKKPKEEIRIKLFFSSNLPSEILTIKNYVKDLLSEYQNYSRSKIYFEFVNANDDKKFKKEAADSGIPSITIQVMEKDKMEYRDIYIGMVMTYKGRYEKLAIISSTDGLEYQISSAIKRLVFPEEKKIAYFTPISFEESKSFEDLPDDPNFQAIGQLISNNYTIDRTDLYYPLPDETDLLIVSGIRDSLDQVQLYLLDQFIMRGKPVLWFQDRYISDINNDQAVLINSNVIKYLFDQSLYIKPNLVLDAYCYQISKYRQQGQYTVPVSFDYPFFPVLQNHNKNHFITRHIGMVQSLFASELYYKQNKNIRFTPLLMSSMSSYELMGKEINTGYQQFQDKSIAAAFTMESKVIAGLYEGKLNSYFQNKSMRHDKYLDQTENAKILLVASNSLADNNILSNVKGNAEFVLNTVDYLCGNAAMIEMRSRTVNYSPLKKTSEKQRFWIKIPVLIIILIAILFYIRKIRQIKRIKKHFQA